MKTATKVMLLLTALAMLVVAQVGPAQATGAFAFTGVADIPNFPCSNTSGVCSGATYTGTATGVNLPAPDCTGGCAVTTPATPTGNIAYAEPPCPTGAPFAPLGSALGAITIGGVDVGFQWTRVGAAAAILFVNPSGVGVAAFEPIAGVDCTPGGAASATIPGVALIAT